MFNVTIFVRFCYFSQLRCLYTGYLAAPWSVPSEDRDKQTALYYCALREWCRAGENVTQPTEDVMVVEGQPTTLTCQFDTTDQSPYLFWYEQLANRNPMFMLRRDRFGGEETATEYKDRFDARLNFTAKSVTLTIQRVQLSESAVYYCALKPTVTTGYTGPFTKTIGFT
uniref:Ig-like domain-containing protein n=1 Tax=Hucho hucho TaxID=62062 RepID=A0A4W5LTD8_9TELE